MANKVGPINTNMQSPWPVEDIQGKDWLYLRVHRNNFRDGKPTIGAFKEHGEGLSTDWSKYSGPNDSRRRGKIPSDNGVIGFQVQNLNAITGIRIQHDPLFYGPSDEKNNRAHTNIKGVELNKPESRVALSRCYQLFIRQEDLLE